MRVLHPFAAGHAQPEASCLNFLFPFSERERETRIVDHLQTDHAAAKRLAATYAEQLQAILRVAEERQAEVHALRQALEMCEAQRRHALGQLTQQQLESDSLRASLSIQRAEVSAGFR